VVFLGAYVALRRKGHMAIEILVARLPGKGQAAFQLGARVAVLAFLAVIAWAGFRLVTMTLEFGRVTPILGISAAWAYLSVPVAAILMAVETLTEIAGAWPFRARAEIAPGSAPGPDMREVGP
jgi:TRAP-type C4-dicarboxylate transport system permease small subunit